MGAHDWAACGGLGDASIESSNDRSINRIEMDRSEPSGCTMPGLPQGETRRHGPLIDDQIANR